MLQTNLNWSKYYDHICCKAYRVLSLLRCSFSSTNSISTKKKLYISLVRSQLTYCSQIWRPALIKDIKKLEKLQRRATKFILGYHLSGLDYKDRLIQLKLLPLMHFFELSDIMFLVNSLKDPSDRFNILEYIQMKDLNTPLSDKPSLKHFRCSSNQSLHFYFNRLPRLWNKLPAVDLFESSNTIKCKIGKALWSHSIDNFDSGNVCTFHFLCLCFRCSTTPSSVSHT